MGTTAPTTDSATPTTPAVATKTTATVGTSTARPAPGTLRSSAARQVRQNRRGYAVAVLRALARSHRGRPAAQIQTVLRSSLTPLGVRLSPTALRGLATDIAAGRSVDLP